MTEETPLPQPDPAAPPPPAPVEKPIFRAAAARQRTVTLEWPLSFQGREYETIIVKRLTVQQLADFWESLKGKPENDAVRFPIYFDHDDNAVPAEVLASLDPDDNEVLQKVVLDFLPRQFRAAAASDSSPPAGEPTAFS